MQMSLFFLAVVSGELAAVAPSEVPAPSTVLKRVFYINLDSSTDRRDHMEHALSGFPGAVKRVPAVKVNELDREPLAPFVTQQGLDDSLKGKYSELVRKTIACWMSHVTLWQSLEKDLEPEERVLILEDDVQFPANWVDNVSETLAGAPAGWDLLKVCGWGQHRSADVVNENWAVPRWPALEEGRHMYMGSCGYIISGSSVSRALKHVLSQPIKDIDVAMMLPAKTDSTVENFAVFEQIPGRRLLGTGGFGSIVHEMPVGFITRALEKKRRSHGKNKTSRLNHAPMPDMRNSGDTQSGSCVWMLGFAVLTLLVALGIRTIGRGIHAISRGRRSKSVPE